jgi:hypothetical protein
MLLKSVAMMCLSLVISAGLANSALAIDRSTLKFARNCQLQGEGEDRCLLVKKPCTVIGSLIAGKGRSASNKKVSFGVGGGWPNELGYNENLMLTKTNGAGKAKITLKPMSRTKGRNATVIFMPAELGSNPAFRYSQLNFKLCN